MPGRFLASSPSQKQARAGADGDTPSLQKIYEFYESNSGKKNRVDEAAVHKILGASGSSLMVREVEEFLEQEKAHA